MTTDPAEEGTPDPRVPVVAPRFWQVPEAEAELPRITPRLRELKEEVARLAQIKEEQERMEKLWGEEADANDQPDAPRRRRLEREWSTLYRSVESELERWRDQGIEVKDIDSGLVDFYALRQGEVIYLCWRDGEEGIGFWHPLNGGYRGRRRLSSAERHGGLDPDPRRSAADR